MTYCDLVVIGGGIVGVSTAWRMQQRLPGAKIVLLEKEDRFARHQTGHNSGVIHAGVYYQPGSLKADFCRRGAAATTAFCQEYGIGFERCGKLLVATDDREYERMAGLEARCAENKIETQRLTAAQLSRKEPSIRGLGGLFVPATGITDYVSITEKIAGLFTALGGRILLESEVSFIEESGAGVELECGREKINTQYLVVCGGLMADRLASMMGIEVDFSIIPFRGEYYVLPENRNTIVKHLIYPIPDPELPFLGVHLTRMIDGSITVGPNAVLGLKREGYGRVNIDVQDILEMLKFPGFWRVLRSNLGSGLAEMRDSLYKPGYLKRIKKYCPEITLSDLNPYPAGIRAQAVLRDGTLVHDFLFVRSERSLHVCNAPSPAATSALPIADYLIEKCMKQFNL